MKVAWSLLLVACDGTATEARIGFLELAFDADPSASPTMRYDTLALIVDEVGFDGHTGSVVLLLQEEEVEPLVAPEEAITIEVDQGTHHDCNLQIALATDGAASAVVATGVLPGDDVDDTQPFHLEIDGIDLPFSCGTIEVGDDPWKATVRLRPLEWLEGITVGPDDDDVLRITPSSGDAYDRLVANVLAAVVLEIDPGSR